MNEGIITQMIILLLIVAVGFIANKAGVSDMVLERKLSKLVINLTAPMLILSSVMGDTLPDKGLILPLIVVGVMTYVVLWIAAAYLPRLFVRNRAKRGMYSFMLMFANVGFMGYPVVASLFGHEAVFYAALLNMSNTFFIFMAGKPMVVADSKRPAFHVDLFLQPGMIACYAAIAIVLLQLDSIPPVISRPVTLIGQITVPGALLIIGSSMADMQSKKLLGSIPIYIMSALRLLGIPIGLFFLLKLCGIDDFLNQINTILIGMPVATFGTMFCLEADRDPTTMVQGTLITTMLSVITIPILTLIF